MKSALCQIMTIKCSLDCDHWIISASISFPFDVTAGLEFRHLRSTAEISRKGIQPKTSPTFWPLWEMSLTPCGWFSTKQTPENLSLPGAWWAVRRDEHLHCAVRLLRLFLAPALAQLPTCQNKPSPGNKHCPFLELGCQSEFSYHWLARMDVDSSARQPFKVTGD